MFLLLCCFPADQLQGCIDHLWSEDAMVTKRR